MVCNIIFALTNRSDLYALTKSDVVVKPYVDCETHYLPFTSQCRKMVRRTLKILQHLLQDF